MVAISSSICSRLQARSGNAREERRPLRKTGDLLAAYLRHSRVIPDGTLATLRFTEFGWTNPILVDAQGGVIAGHGRLLAARLSLPFN